MSSDWLINLLPKQNGQHIKTILPGIIWKIGSSKGTTGCHEISQADQLVTYGSRFDLSWPADDQRRTVPTLPLVSLHASPGLGPVMIVVTSHIGHGVNFRSIVAGKDDQGIVRHAQLFESGEQLAHHVVHLYHEIPMSTRSAFPQVLFCREGGQVDCLHGMK